VSTIIDEFEVIESNENTKNLFLFTKKKNESEDKRRTVNCSEP
jgi:hypothetical protein